MVSGLCFTLNLVIFLVAVGITHGMIEPDCHDVVIIGAGASGTFAAWRLRNSGLDIAVFEYSDRVGGRVFTRRFEDAPDLNIELGAMRFIPSEHRRTMKLAQELGLTIIDFVEGFGRPERSFYYLRNRHLYEEELGTSIRTPYNLLPEEFRPPGDLRYYISSRFTNYSEPNNPMHELETEYLKLQTVTVDDGIPLFHQSAREVYEKSVSHEAFLYVRDTTAFWSFLYEAQSTDHIPRPAPGNSSPGDDVVLTVAEGYIEVPVRLLDQFLQRSPNRHRYFRNAKLIKIRRLDGGEYGLTFRRTVTIKGHTEDTSSTFNVCSRRVIIAIPDRALRQVDWPGLKDQQTCRILDSLNADPAHKIFLLYPYRWWTLLPHPALRRTHTKSDLPVRQTYDFGVSLTGKAALLISYADGRDDVSFWRNLQSKGTCVSRICDANMVTNEVVRHAHIYLSRLYNVSIHDIPPPVDGLMVTWDDYPFYAGWKIWKPGSYFLLDMLRIMKPSEEDEIFLLNSDFATIKYTGWVEGGLHAADILLEKYFGIPKYL